MPLNCCVPQCTSKGYRSTVGEKISYFSFPKSEELKKEWIGAIRRDQEKGFNLKPSTKVCSQHFNQTDLNKSLNGIVTLKKGSVPSKFSWLNGSSCERATPDDGQKSDSNADICINVTSNAANTQDIVHIGSDPDEPLIVESKSVEELSREQLKELKSINRALEEKVLALETDLSQKNYECKQFEYPDEPLTVELKSVEEVSREQLKELKSINRALKEKVLALEADLSQKNYECKQFEQQYREVYLENKTTKQTLIDREKNVQLLKQELESLQSLIFTLDRFKADENISFYTGFPNFEAFMAIFRFFNVGDNGENIRYSSNKQDVPAEFYNCENEDVEDDNKQENYLGSKKGRPRKLKPVEQFFLVMCRLRRGFREQHLAHLFGVSQSTVSRVFISWINYMFLKFGQINIWPTKEVVLKTMPESFKESYPNTRIIIDCTEIRVEMPSSLLVNTELFSSYKNHQTFKALLGIAPSGAITFISELYTGNISDREIVIRSGLLDQAFESGDSVMADKGFTIEDILPLGVSLNIPPFLGQNSQMSAEDVVKTQTIASVRIHIERAINKIKNFRIWQGDFPLNLIGVANLMWAVCAFLCNAHDPLISA